jgi:tetratricopeptide (TPR) repeat protein
VRLERVSSTSRANQKKDSSAVRGMSLALRSRVRRQSKSPRKAASEMFTYRASQLKPGLLVAAILLISSPVCRQATENGAEVQVCNVNADYSLGVEDYSDAIRIHREILRKNPGNALAHYHLGFAEGMIGDRATEIDEYRRAEALGLRTWDLFLNQGLAQLQSGNLDAATDSLRQAVLLGENHSESHFNLALVFQRRGMLADAEREMLASLRLNPDQPDAWNTLGVIYAEQGRTARAWLVWRELVRDMPDYDPPRTNLSILSSQNNIADAETAAAVPPPPVAAVRVSKGEPATLDDVRDLASPKRTQ